MSGTASLVLKQSEINILNQHYKTTLQNLLKLNKKTPDPVVFFLAGSLPAVALLHLKQLSLFSMITRLPNNILNRIGRYFLTTSHERSKSWFLSVRDICLMYMLPHPLSLMESPLSKVEGKQLFRSRVTDFWQTKLRNDTSVLPSLRYFKPQYMTLSRPHPLFQTCGNNSYEICKAISQACMLSGRYPTDRLVRHFHPGSDGNCSLCSDNVPGTIEHLLMQCSSLNETRQQLLVNLEKNNFSDLSKSLILKAINPVNIEEAVQFLLDCSNNPNVISAIQMCGPVITEELFRFTRSWCYSIHRRKLKLQGRWTKPK